MNVKAIDETDFTTDEEEEIDDGVGESKSNLFLIQNEINVNSYLQDQIHMKSTKV
jgi:hypothetical protein